MFGKILNITDSTVEIEINKNAEVIPNLMNLHVVFIDGDTKLLGEVRTVLENTIHVDLKGQFIGEKFIAGTIKKPSLTSTLRLINDEE